MLHQPDVCCVCVELLAGLWNIEFLEGVEIMLLAAFQSVLKVAFVARNALCETFLPVHENRTLEH
jgi:hypothetical protein